ncbi:hypothetical protein RN001_005818 [Aquatica leii]|uniref:Uncharacterized protein n=1 Tax=Aquatica leii TaxID=1421715 RepID=A0AAN7Q0W2_9COLE|nr:hypothetical protein RN001_005818 [Aquatica leii]
MRTPLRSISNVSPGPSTSQSVQPPLSVASPSPSTSQCVLPPLPIAKKRAVRQRTKVPSLLISSTPVKLYFENKENEKREAVEKAQRRLQKKEEKEKLENKKKKATNSRKKRVESSESEDSNDEVDVIYAETSNDDMDFGEEDKNVCAICGQIGKLRRSTTKNVPRRADLSFSALDRYCFVLEADKHSIDETSRNYKDAKTLSN